MLPKILIVDDDESVIQSYRTSLEPTQNLKSLDEAAMSLFDDDDDSEILDEADLLGGEDEEMLMDDELPSGVYDISYVTQGLEAIQTVQEACRKETPFSLVFLDMRMPPGIDGLETAKAIRKLDPYLEIVIMTAYSDYTYEEIAEEVGNPEKLLYFHKPFQPEKIQQLASSLTQKWFIEKKSRES